MKRLIATILLLCAAINAWAFKVYVFVDMEGCTGITSREQVLNGEGALSMACDINACVDACFKAGATSVVVRDGHGKGNNVDPKLIDKRAELIQGPTPYERFKNIEGSEASLLMAQLRATARVVTRSELREQAQQLIMQNPRSLAAYYAVFLKQNGEYIWNIFDASDRRMYQVVATSFQTWMPDHERTKILCNQVKEVIHAERSAQSQQAVHQLIADSENAFLDIELPDENGQMQALSQFRGCVILLDFSSAEMQQAIAYTFELRELYNEYHKRGLEIYSVSLNRNRLAWQDAAANLPWTTVQLDETTATPVLLRYNVQALPTLFLFDKKGNVQGRYSDFTKLEADIRKYLQTSAATGF